MKTKHVKIIYWSTTVIVSVMMVVSAFLYLTSELAEKGFQHAGFPGYFRIELAIAKLLGAVLLIVPLKQHRVKDWVYAGFAITFVSAFISHAASGDPVSARIAPVIFLVILVVSYISWDKLASVQKEQNTTPISV